MERDPWLPIGFGIDETSHLLSASEFGAQWQIWELREGERVILVENDLRDAWLDKKLIEPDETSRLPFGERDISVLRGGGGCILSQVSAWCGPANMPEAMAFARALKATRERVPEDPIAGGIYVERLQRILPVHGDDAAGDDALVLGKWLSGGIPVSASDPKALGAMLSWMGAEGAQRVALTAGLKPGRRANGSRPSASAAAMGDRFELAGRKALEEFFNEHVIDVVKNPEHYRRMGISHPGSVILEGPTGSGKTFAVDELAKFLGWPRFDVEAGSVASPFIHETSKKISEVFEAAIKAAPSIVVIDEMDAFLSHREAGSSGQHRIEEISEFLRRIPEAVSSGVLVLGMTNRIQSIDPAILRRGRFDHMLHVGYPEDVEVKSALESLLKPLPVSEDADIGVLVDGLMGRPMSDVAFVVREAARLAARERADSIDPTHLTRALASATSGRR